MGNYGNRHDNPGVLMLVALSSAVTAASLGALLHAEHAHRRLLQRVAKPTASAGFLAAAFAAGALDTDYGCAILAALVCSAIGDVCLLGRNRIAFLTGLTAFLLGHLGFAVAFAIRGIDPTWFGATTPVVGLASGVALWWLLPKVNDHTMRLPILAYVAVISAMVALATGTVGAHGTPLILIAAVAFYLSDLSVARDRFVAPGFGNVVWGLPAYYGAQIAFAWSLV